MWTALRYVYFVLSSKLLRLDLGIVAYVPKESGPLAIMTDLKDVFVVAKLTASHDAMEFL
jgi:hypothetical protein